MAAIHFKGHMNNGKMLDLSISGFIYYTVPVSSDMFCSIGKKSYFKNVSYSLNISYELVDYTSSFGAGNVAISALYRRLCFLN